MEIVGDKFAIGLVGSVGCGATRTPSAGVIGGIEVAGLKDGVGVGAGAAIGAWEAVGVGVGVGLTVADALGRGVLEGVATGALDGAGVGVAACGAATGTAFPFTVTSTRKLWSLVEFTLASVSAALKDIKFSSTLIDVLKDMTGTLAVNTVCDFVTRKTLKM
jgi:hypothetical protein